MCRLAAPSAFSHFHIFFKFIKTSTIAVSTATLLSFIHYSFLSWQAITTARLQVHYAHMKPITPSGLANSSNIYLLPCEQRVNLPVTLKTVLPLWNKNITLPAPETALMLNLLSNFKTMPQVWFQSSRRKPFPNSVTFLCAGSHCSWILFPCVSRYSMSHTWDWREMSACHNTLDSMFLLCFLPFYISVKLLIAKQKRESATALNIIKFLLKLLFTHTHLLILMLQYLSCI